MQRAFPKPAANRHPALHGILAVPFEPHEDKNARDRNPPRALIVAGIDPAGHR